MLFFGRLVDAMGIGEIAHQGGMTLSALIADLGKNDPVVALALAEPSVRVGLNLALIAVGADPMIGGDDEVAFMPPVSGG